MFRHRIFRMTAIYVTGLVLTKILKIAKLTSLGPSMLNTLSSTKVKAFSFPYPFKSLKNPRFVVIEWNIKLVLQPYPSSFCSQWYLFKFKFWPKGDIWWRRGYAMLSENHERNISSIPTSRDSHTNIDKILLNTLTAFQNNPPFNLSSQRDFCNAT